MYYDFISGKSAGVFIDYRQFYKADPTDLKQALSNDSGVFFYLLFECENLGWKRKSLQILHFMRNASQ